MRAPSARTMPDDPTRAATPLALTTNTQTASTVARKSDAPLEAIPILPLAFSEFRIFWIKVLPVGHLGPLPQARPPPRMMYNFVEGYRVQVYRPPKRSNSLEIVAEC